MFDNSASKIIQPLPLVDECGRPFFDVDECRYVVPLYQRAFAWGAANTDGRENEILQLIDDILDVGEGESYYLGSLVVNRVGDECEVVDGQQRLTALFMLFSCLGLTIKKSGALTYACREKSNYTLSRISDLMVDPNLLEKSFDSGIHNGIRAILGRVKGNDVVIRQLKENMRRVKLFRIELPPETDLNRYFEVMNTRGEQLEQHDIVKALLMKELDRVERPVFAKIWNACSDMSGYVQMHFDMTTRRSLFTDNWNWLRGDRITSRDDAVCESDTLLTVNEIIQPEFNPRPMEVTSIGDRVRFESIIDFPFFLLHVLKVFVSENGIVHGREGQSLLDELIDDKKLIESFERVREEGVWNGVKIDSRKFAWEFIWCLLKCRVLFDKFIIKRELTDEDSYGVWSLKEMLVSGEEGELKPYYRQTEFADYGGWKKKAQYLKRQNLMIQSCLRVSYTSPKSMHWITRLLRWLYANDCEHIWGLSAYCGVAEDIAKEAVSGFALGNNHSLGVSTPHIVFNYLDYLLWKRNRARFDDFVFEFRTSVEHWYPQHPSEGTFDEWGEVNRFGNLCIIQRNVNSKFSNLSPESKKGTFGAMIGSGSIKLRIMAESLRSNTQWRDQDCAAHEQEMLEILRSACVG